MPKITASERTYVSFDWALKRLLRNKASFVILEGFLTELLKQEIQVISLLESESNAETEFDKINRVDLLCENHRKELVIIEVQYHRELDYFQRILFGASRLISEYLKRGAPYEEVRKLYSVHILYFDLGQGTDYVYHGLLAFKGLRKGDVLGLSASQRNKYNKQQAGELFPEYYLLKINNFDEVARDTLDEWIYYLKTSSLPKVFRAQGLAEVEEQLNFDAMTPEVKAKYMKHLEALNISESMLESAYLEGQAVSFENGKVEGKLEGKLEGMRAAQWSMVKSAAERGLAVDIIASIVDVSVEEVQRILESNDGQ